jgi:hypothetical protein
MTKVKIMPMIEYDTLGKVNLPVVRFRVIEEAMATRAASEREVSVIDASTTEGCILGEMQIDADLLGDMI